MSSTTTQRCDNLFVDCLSLHDWIRFAMPCHRMKGAKLPSDDLFRGAGVELMFMRWIIEAQSRAKHSLPLTLSHESSYSSTTCGVQFRKRGSHACCVLWGLVPARVISIISLSVRFWSTDDGSCLGVLVLLVNAVVIYRIVTLVYFLCDMHRKCN